jgi:hypothetical protein
VTSWSSQPLPSGSLNDAYAKYERSFESKPGGRASYTSPTSTPRLMRSARAGVDVFDGQDQPVEVEPPRLLVAARAMQLRGFAALCMKRPNASDLTDDTRSAW